MAKRESKISAGADPVQEMEVSERLSPPEDEQEGSERTADAGTQQVQRLSSEVKDESEEEHADFKKVPVFKVTCRNKISKVIGGVSFVDGVGYTSDGFTASWFANKDGYVVKEAGS